jgi:peptide/nickel transport system ATP-binding protein
MSPTTGATAFEGPLLSISDLRVSYGTRRHRTQALHGVSLDVARGETVAIVGESGSGKSTTAQAVIRLLAAGGAIDSGEVRFRGADLAGLSEKEMREVRGASIGLIPQDPMSSLNPVIKVGKQVVEALDVHGRVEGDAAEQAIGLLRNAGLANASRVAAQYPHQLSGGMRQRVLIAIALACQPDLVIADEPTSALDVTVQRLILDHIDRRTSETDASVLLITHDLGVAADRADRIVVMNRGQIVEQGSADEVLGDPQDPYTRRLLAAAPSLSSTPLYAPISGWRTAEAPAPLLSVTKLRKTFQVPGSDEDLVAVGDVSFDIHPGETLGIVGESGSGKSTAARLLLRLEESDSGSIVFDGRPIESLRGEALRLTRRSMQMVYQNPFGSLSPHLSVGEAIAEPLLIHRLADKKERREIAAGLLEQVALDASMIDRSPTQLSGGQRQRVAIARSLALEPKLIVCDEAVSALDVSVQAQILELLATIQRERGIAFLFISHDLAVIRQIAHRVVVMRGGTVVESGETAAIFDSPRAEYTRELLAAIPGQEHSALSRLSNRPTSHLSALTVPLQPEEGVSPR